VEGWWGRRRALDGWRGTPLLELGNPGGVQTIGSFIGRHPSRALRTGLETAGHDEDTIKAFLYFLMDSLVDLFRRVVWLPRCMGLEKRGRATWAPRPRQPTGRPRGRPRKVTTTTLGDPEAGSGVTELWRATMRAGDLVLRGVASPGLWSVAA
jgi:hypothetical protein